MKEKKCHFLLKNVTIIISCSRFLQNAENGQGNLCPGQGKCQNFFSNFWWEPRYMNWYYAYFYKSSFSFMFNMFGIHVQFQNLGAPVGQYLGSDGICFILLLHKLFTNLKCLLFDNNC